MFSRVSLRHFRLFHTNLVLKSSAMANNDCTHMVWMDLEMTGLDPKKDKILEVACIITDKDLNVITEEGLDIIINQTKEVLDNMNDWCKVYHNKSGLVQECLNSKISHEEAEFKLLEFLKKYVPERLCPLAGSSVYMDRFFLMHHMPILNEYLHYRNIDVSTIKELCLRWNPQVLKCAPKKSFAHRSLDDIKESIDELRFYQKNLFKQG